MYRYFRFHCKRTLRILQLSGAAGQRDVADRRVISDADRTIRVLVHHLQFLHVAAHRNDHPPTGLQLLQQRLRDVRRCCSNMDRVVGRCVREAKPAICRFENSQTSYNFR